MSKQSTLNTDPCLACHIAGDDLVRCKNLVQGENGRTGDIIECPACLCPCENEDCNQSPYYDW